MAIFIQRFSVLICALLLASCASTSITDYTDPSYTETTFHSVAVWAHTTDLNWRQDLETRMQARVHSETGATAVRAIDISPPTRAFSVDETYQLLAGANVDAAIVVVFTDSGVSQSISSDGYGNVNTYDKPWSEATVNLVDVKSGSVAWTGTAKTRGNAFADWNDIRQSAGNQVIARLLANGILPPPVNDSSK